MQNQLFKKALYSAHIAFLSSIRRLFFSTSLPSAEYVTPNPPIKPPFEAVEYLVKSCGLPLEKAIRASRYLSHLKSSQNPDSVLQFLREYGLSEIDITRAVSYDARLLCVKLEKTMKPKITELQKIGFTPFQIAQLISFCPYTIKSMPSGALRKKIEFLTPFLGSLKGILRASKNNQHLLSFRTEKVIERNIAFLQEHCGVSPNQIGKIITAATCLFAMKPNSLDAKIKNLKNIGFSKTEIESMIFKQPMLLSNTDERIRNSVDFLTSEAGFDLPYVANAPILISFSLERRIIPRHYVLKSLELKALCEKVNFYAAMILSEKRFNDKFVRPYKDMIPEICVDYEAACAGKISLRGRFLDAPTRKLA